MKDSKRIQTIILTVFIFFFVFLTIRILPINLHQSLENMGDSMNEDFEGEAAILYYGAIIFGVGIAIIFLHGIAIFIMIASVIFALLALHNRHSESRGVRFFNYALFFICLFMFIAPLVKMILWRCGY